MPSRLAAARRFVDLHTHILPGIDDGAATIEESLELARRLAASGVRVVAATPHRSDAYSTTVQMLKRELAVVRAALLDAEIELELVSGAEVALDQLDTLTDRDLTAFTLGAAGRFLLLEFPYEGWPVGLPTRITELAARGISVVLAHPERNLQVQAAPQRLAGLVDCGALVQLNAGSLLRGNASHVTATARSLLDSGLVHLIGSDSHRPGRRPTIADAAATLPPPLFDWLACHAPEAILAGDRPPPTPQVRRRRRRLFAG
jgi:protein-tyrosine phosphatase